MEKKLLFFILMSFSSVVYSQNNNDVDAGSWAVLIRTTAGEGSGFYMKDTARKIICLVTASHVIIDPIQKKLFSDSILFTSYKKNSQRDDRDSFMVSLVAASQAGLLQYNIQDDVAVIQFAKSQDRAISYLPFVRKVSKSNTFLNIPETTNFASITQLNTLLDIYTVGYPKSLTLVSFDYNRPLIRKGMISGIDRKTNRIIVDCATYQGNSGGMVFALNPMSGEVGIVGLVSQFVPFEERWINEAYKYFNTNVYNSGYSVVIPADLIMQQINLIKR